MAKLVRDSKPEEPLVLDVGGVSDAEAIADPHQEPGHARFVGYLRLCVDVGPLRNFERANRQRGEPTIIDDLLGGMFRLKRVRASPTWTISPPGGDGSGLPDRAANLARSSWSSAVICSKLRKSFSATGPAVGGHALAAQAR